MGATTHFISFQERLIETTVTNEVSIAKNWILAVRSACQEDPTVIISLNSRTLPQDDAIIVILCIKTKCLILQLLHLNQNTNIQEYLSQCGLFSDERFVFVGIDIAKTALRLDSVIGCAKKVDVRDLVKVNFPFGYGVRSRVSLKVMAWELLGFGSWKSKKEIYLRVANEVLDEEVIKLLTVDTYVCYEIGFKMLRQHMF